jgi:hypothetical protein
VICQRVISRPTVRRRVIERGIERGALGTDLDIGVDLDARYGATYCRLLVSLQAPELGYATRSSISSTPPWPWPKKWSPQARTKAAQQ